MLRRKLRAMSVSSSYLEDGRARAKINLTLHVGRVIADGRYKGYHPVDSLVAFAGAADRIKYCPKTKDFQFEIQGPFGEGLEADNDNLITRTAHAFFERLNVAPFGKFILEKNLPIASGIGGGSADAAAALRLLLRENKELAKDIEQSEILAMAEALGADVPVCFHSKTSFMRGIGEQIELLDEVGRIPALLVNPGFGVSTAEIFKAYDAVERAIDPAPQLKSGSLLERVKAGRNDLQDIAISLRPEIGQLIEQISETPGCLLSRMSGSGATCFGLFTSFDKVVEARDIISHAHPNYWFAPTLLGDASWSS